jgi:hypothetical protein
MSSNQVPRTGWLWNVPPFRMPMPKRRRHPHHELGDALASGCATAFGLMFVGGFFVGLWFYEAVLWGTVWIYYGAFLGLRWAYRSNVAGRAWMMVTRWRKRPVERPAAFPAPSTTRQRPTAVQHAVQGPYGRGIEAWQRELLDSPDGEPPQGDMRRRG